MTESTLPLPPGHPSDLPGQTASVTFTTPGPLVERLPDRVAGRALVVVAIGGLLAQLLFFGQQPGLNFPIWVAFVLAAAVLIRRPDAHMDRADAWMPVAALVFATLCAVVADGMLLLFDVAATGALTIASIVAIGGQPLTRRPWQTSLIYGIRAIGAYLFGAPHLANGFRALPRARADRQTTSWRVVRGLVLAVPLVLVFAALFAGADAVFQSLVAKALPADLGWTDIAGRVFIALVAAWLLAGAIVCGWLTRETNDETVEGEANPMRVGYVEAVVVLAAIDAIFLVFVVLQATYLFGGVDTLQITGLTYSEYARRGFGELIAVAVLSGAVLVLLGQMVRERGHLYRLLAAVLCVATGVVVASAFMRITLYQQAYGWTELRFYTVAGIVLLAICAAAALLLTALDRPWFLPRVALGAGLAIAIVCNVIGPQALVTQQNVYRVLNPDLVAPGGVSGLDVDYVSSLGPDSARILALSRNNLPVDMLPTIDAALSDARQSLSYDASAGWPSWNYTRQRALETLILAGY